MKEIALAAICGLYCGDCELLGDKCTGCNNIEGKPFWAELYDMEVCQLYGCCVKSKMLEHCGLCDELPCEPFSTMRDPALTDEEFEQSIKDRINTLKTRKEMGDEAWSREEP